MVCVFDPLLPGFCFHASCYTLFLDLIVPFFCFYLFIFRITLLFSLLLASWGYSEG